MILDYRLPVSYNEQARLDSLLGISIYTLQPPLLAPQSYAMTRRPRIICSIAARQPKHSTEKLIQKPRARESSVLDKLGALTRSGNVHVFDCKRNRALLCKVVSIGAGHQWTVHRLASFTRPSFYLLPAVLLNFAIRTASTVALTFSWGDHVAMRRRAFNFISARAIALDNSF